MKPKAIWELIKETLQAWNEDNVPRLGAALAYYTVFSLAPLLLIAIGIAGLIFGAEVARGQIVGQLGQLVGTQTGQAIEEMLANNSSTGGSTLATVIGVVILLFGASGVFVELQNALNAIWKVKPKPGRGLWGMVQDRLFSFAVVLGTGFLLLVSLVISAALAALGKFLTSGALPGGVPLWQAVNALISFGFVTLLFALMYKYLPDAKVEWRDVWVGAALTALLFTLGKYLIGLYVGYASVASGFGAAGSLVVVLVWVYYSSQLVLLGAEFTHVYARWTGSPVTPSENAEPAQPEACRIDDRRHPSAASAASPAAPR